MATTSLGSSTTQMTVRSRRGSRQTRHSSCSLTLPQIRQKRTLSFTSVSAETSRRTSTGSAASRWNAIRWALLGPTPGSRPSSSIRSCTAPSYIGRLHAGQPEAAHPLGQRTHLLLGQLRRGPARITDRRDDEVLQALDVVRVDGLRVDLDRAHLAGTGDDRGDQPAPGGPAHLRLGQLLLRREHLL